jgi:NADPH:quinone reductase-like Zn-dependent oxidoreductase
MSSSRAVRFSRFGGPEVLELVEVPVPDVPPGRVRVRVEAAGLNPFDTKRRRGLTGEVRFPAGNGSDFAGTVDAVGEEVDGFALGDAVLGRAPFSAQADHVLAKPDALVRRPATLPVEVAAALDTAGRTAWDTVAFAGVRRGDTVLVSAAAGGVGVLAAQLARRAGAIVIGTAGTSNAAFLTSLGIVPVRYGKGLVDRVRAVAPQGVTVVLDNSGRETIEAGLALGTAPERIVTIADRDAAAELGTADLPRTPADSGTLAAVAALIADGELRLPIDRVFPVEEVVAAYEHLERGHLRGKVVLRF